MSTKASVIRDLIIPLDRYPQLNENQTLQEAIQAFMALGEKGHCYGMLLVANEQNQLVGKLTRIDILHGLVPKLVEASQVKEFEGKDAEYPNLTFLYEDKTFAVCGDNQLKPIKPLLRAIDFSLSADTHILKAIAMMSHRNDYNVPVTEDGEIIGMLRLEELFNVMCTTYCTI